MPPPSIVREKAAKIATMSWDEVRTRLRQEVNKRRDALVWRVGAGSVSRETRIAAKPSGDGDHHLDQAPLTWEAISPPRFFFSPSDLPAILKVLRERLTAQVQTILEQAERICRHEFDLLGYKELHYGKLIDWRIDPVNGKRAPRKPWYKIRFLDFNIAGDHKVIWELNRHQHFPVLAKAYLLSGEDRFVRELVHQWQHWRQENPYPFGINWASSLEVAFRSLSWIWASQLLGSNSAALHHFQSELQESLALNAQHLERYLSTYWSPNTHLLGEGVGLFFIGSLCPGLRSAPRWREMGWRIVLEQAERQVERDGTHFERSLYYHVYALDLFLHARLLASKNGISIPGSLDRTIEKMMAVLCGLAQAGPLPRFGDDDGGRVFDPRRNQGRRLLDPLSIGAMLFDRQDFKAASSGLTEETLWLLGPIGADRFDALPSEVPRAVSRSFPAGGFYVMASSEPGHLLHSPARQPDALRSPEDSRRQMVVRAGPLGAGNSGHSHADVLSVHLSAGGEEWLVDPGTFKYVSAGHDRDMFRSTAAHNTLQVDGLSQADPRGPFAWQAPPKTSVEHWIEGETFDLFVASHNGYQRLEQPVTHRRSIVHLKSGLWLIRDVAEGADEHQLDLFWHFGPRLVPSYTPPGFTLSRPREAGPHGLYEGVHILPCEGNGWSQEIQRGFVSPAYGIEEPAAVVRFSTRTALPAELAVVLRLFTETCSDTGRLVSIPAADGTPTRGFRYEEADARSVFLFGTNDVGSQSGVWKSDAHFIYAAANPHQRKFSVALCGGSYLEIGGEQVIACCDPLERYELSFASGRHRVFSSDPDALVRCNSEAILAALDGGLAFECGTLHNL